MMHTLEMTSSFFPGELQNEATYDLIHLSKPEFQDVEVAPNRDSFERLQIPSYDVTHKGFCPKFS